MPGTLILFNTIILKGDIFYRNETILKEPHRAELQKLVLAVHSYTLYHESRGKIINCPSIGSKYLHPQGRLDPLWFPCGIYRKESEWGHSSHKGLIYSSKHCFMTLLFSWFSKKKTYIRMNWMLSFSWNSSPCSSSMRQHILGLLLLRNECLLNNLVLIDPTSPSLSH